MIIINIMLPSMMLRVHWSIMAIFTIIVIGGTVAIGMRCWRWLGLFGFLVLVAHAAAMAAVFVIGMGSIRC